MKRTFFCVSFLLLWFAAATAQDCKKTDYGPEQQKYMETSMQQFASCDLKADASCRSFLAQSLEHIYGVKDFGSSGKYSTAGEIARKVTDDSTWEHLGSASDQDVLKNAAASAGCGKAVLAVLASDTGGHVALILPGSLAHSGGWKLDVPNSASFFMNNPSKSYAGKPLSYAFANSQNIEIYARKNQ